MNADLPGNSPSPSTAVPKRNPVVGAIVSVLLMVLAVVVVYSVYVAVHEADPQETVILGQAQISSGGPAAMRILVRDRRNGRPVAGAKVGLRLSNKTAGTVNLGTFRTDSTGSLADSIPVPELPPGEYRLIVEVASALGRDRVERMVEVQHSARILVTSDKPIYQPGQAIHLRSLALNGRTGQPITNGGVTFEVTDPKGNKVFKETHKASRFGIASTDFVLASELNLGRYQIRALAGAATVERTVEVKRYVLPKFKIQITSDKPYYLPGETVSGYLVANYFFGKPAADASVKLTAVTFHEKPVVLSESTGRTDATGKLPFRFVLPNFFVGLPQKNEQAFLDLTAEVRDSAGHAEEKTLSLSVVQNELEVTVIPEAGALVPGVENVLYVLTAYPDGRPADCRVFVDGTAYPGNADGICEIRLTPADLSRNLEVQAVDPAGKRGKFTYRSDNQRVSPAFLLRVDKAIYEAGHTAQINILSPEKNNTVFIDAIKDGQTVLTRSLSLRDHKAQYALPIPPSLVGPLKLNAYVISETGEDRGCSRLILVHPASGLRIAATPSKPVFRPGEIARLDFAVTDAEGRPAPGALGIAAVDESVFALDENRPGLLKQFLDVESDLLKPRYQIKFFDSPGRWLDSRNQTMAAAYFATLGERSAGPTIDDLVRDGEIPQRLIDHARSMRGTPAYEALRSDPQYAAIVQLLEGTKGTYSLRETTGPEKVQATEAHRKAYFRNLQRSLQVIFLGALFLTPILLLIHYSRPGAGMNLRELGEGQTADYIRAANSLHNILAALTLLPIMCYPIGLFALERSHPDNLGWILLGFETVVVLFTVFLQHARIASLETGRPQGEFAPLRGFLGVFLGQFVIARGGFVIMILSRHISEGFALLWLLGTIVAPLFVMGSLSVYIRRQLEAKGISTRIGRMSAIELLVVISIIAVLTAMLLPALAKAKSKSHRISLMSDLRQIDIANQIAQADGANPDVGASTRPRVRRDFPETLLWRPELITDDHGKATLEIPLADSITTWRTSIDAINAAGRMGSSEIPITVFQDFFVDLDLPVSMSLGDQISVPVTCYNYLKDSQEVRCTLVAGDWFESSTTTFSLRLGPNEVKSASIPIKVLRVGNHALRVDAQGDKISDAIEREIRVVPTGKRMDYARNAILKEAFADVFTIPAGTIPDSASLCARFYPSRFSEVVEGLEAVFQAPYGCFEQTSSVTYPNVLVLDYMKRMGRLTPEIEIKARKFINAGYQRLLTFEVAGGGFEWFGRDPANVCLTAYGVLEFTDMARVHPVDAAVIERARKWLFAKQNNDGSWSETHRGWTWGRRGSMTAFVAWALAESGDQSSNLEKALNYLRSHPQELENTYAKALAANALLAHDRNDSVGRQIALQLKESAICDNEDAVHWNSSGQSVTYSRGSGMDTECTALCAMALMKSGTSPQTAKRALTWISTHKFADGSHGSTQATILAMRALLEASATSFGQEFESSITVLLNGQPIETFRVNKDNSDVMKQIDLTRSLRAGENRIQFRQSPSGELPVQLTGSFWLPAATKPELSLMKSEPLEIDVQFDRTQLSVNEQLRCTVAVKNHTEQLINMAIVDLGIPPGFDVDTTAFEEMLQKERIAKFDVTGTQVILYLRELSNTNPFQFSYSLRAKYPLRVQAPAAAVYEYYQPQNRAQSQAVQLRVAGARSANSQ